MWYDVTISILARPGKPRQEFVYKSLESYAKLLKLRDSILAYTLEDNPTWDVSFALPILKLLHEDGLKFGKDLFFAMKSWHGRNFYLSLKLIAPSNVPENKKFVLTKEAPLPQFTNFPSIPALENRAIRATREPVNVYRYRYNGQGPGFNDPSMYEWIRQDSAVVGNREPQRVELIHHDDWLAARWPGQITVDDEEE